MEDHLRFVSNVLYSDDARGESRDDEAHRNECCQHPQDSFPGASTEKRKQDHINFLSIDECTPVPTRSNTIDRATNTAFNQNTIQYHKQ